MNEVQRMNGEYPSMKFMHVPQAKDPYQRKSLKILDTCDFLVLGTSSPQEGWWPSSTMERALELYKEMDINVIVTDTSFSVTNEMMEFIASICGRHVASKKCTVSKLLVDISKIIEFHFIKTSWTEKKTAPHKDVFGPVTQSTRSMPLLNAPVTGNETSSTMLCDLQGYDSGSCSYGILDDTSSLEGTPQPVVFIVYHTLYNITLTIKERKAFFTQVCEDFPEFRIMADFPCHTHGQDMYESAKQFFHQKIFEEEQDLQKKVEAFRALFNLVPTYKDKEECNEIEEVKIIMNRLFDISTDPKERIKALELYQKVSNLIPGSNRVGNDTAQQKRFAVYFMEMGLTRKRFSDGVYYYGIRYKQSEASGASVEDLMNQRNYEPKNKETLQVVTTV